MLPSLRIIEAVEKIAGEGLNEPFLGRVGAGHVQLCPQSMGLIDEALCDDLLRRFPATRFRLHANARVLPRHLAFDASTPWKESVSYFGVLADRSRRLGATGYSVHAGYRTQASIATMIDNVRRIQDTFGPECTVAVEGLYPHPKRPHLVASWSEYEAVLAAGVPLAIDLSHVALVAAADGRNDQLTAVLVGSPTTIELHLSGNDGRTDRHDPLRCEPWWFSLLACAGANAVIFCESNMRRPIPLLSHASDGPR